jgi:predicted ABC-type ATPase
MLERLRLLAHEEKNFAFETTLASKSFATWIPELKAKGYRFHLIFLWLDSVDLALSRVKERVKTGGHLVPEDTIRRRYTGGLKNFFKLYQPIAHSWQFWDNSHSNKLTLIASQENKDLIIKDNATWQAILETHSEK